MIFVGIDPGGATGACAFVDCHPDDYYPLHYGVIPMPLQTPKTVDAAALYRWFVSLVDEYGCDIAMITIENVHSMPKQGVSSTFNFGWNSGTIAATAALFCDHHAGSQYMKVTPQKWKKKLLAGTLGYKSIDKKAAAIAYVTANWPDLNLLRKPKSRKPDHNFCDAVCLMVYGRLYYEHG